MKRTRRSEESPSSSKSKIRSPLKSRTSYSNLLSPTKRNPKLESRHALPAGASSTSPPQSSPRLRRLGVRQAEDQASTTTESSHPDSQANPEDADNRRRQRQRRNAVEKSQTMNLLRTLGIDSKYSSMNMPSQKQLQQFLSESPGAETDKPTSDNQASAAKSSGSSLNPLGRTKVLKCPVCEKLFLSFHGHDLHLDTHENASIKCWTCNLRFCSNKSLLQHQRYRHNKRQQEDELTGKGFHNLIFADFSCDKFPAIAQKYCETHSVQPASSFHNYTCDQCSKSFPSDASLHLHTTQYHYFPSKFICTLCNHDYMTKGQLELHRQAHPSCSSKKYISNHKRRFLRALSLMPQCAAAQSSFDSKHKPAVNLEYYKQLRQVETITQLTYTSAEIPSHEEDDSDSSQG